MGKKQKKSGKKKWRQIPAKWIALSGLQTVPAWMAIWQPPFTAVLISWSWWNFPFAWFSLQLEDRKFFPFKTENPSWITMASKCSKTMRCTLASCLIRLHLSKHRLCLNSSKYRSDFTPDMYKWRFQTQMCTPITSCNNSPKMAARINVGQTLKPKTIVELLTAAFRMGFFNLF